jgi:hypothetical protein
MHMEPHRLANALGITAVATAWFPQEGDTRLVLHHQLSPDLIDVRPMIPAIPSGDVHDLVLGFRVVVVAPIDMNARGVKMDKAGCKIQALSRGCRQEAIAFGHPISIEGLQGPA